MQVVKESRAQRHEALQYIAAVKAAFPEVLQAIKTLQLAQEMLMFKEAYLSEIGKTGMPFQHLGLCGWAVWRRMLGIRDRCKDSPCRNVRGSSDKQAAVLMLEQSACCPCTGLVDEVEMEQLQTLVDRKLKRLHFSPPRLPHQLPAAALAAHPLFADVPAASFDAQVSWHTRGSIWFHMRILCSAVDHLPSNLQHASLL